MTNLERSWLIMIVIHEKSEFTSQSVILFPHGMASSPEKVVIHRTYDNLEVFQCITTLWYTVYHKERMLNKTFPMAKFQWIEDSF